MTDEDNLGLRCTETDDGELRCDYDLVDDDGEVHMEVVCEEEEDEPQCEVNISVTGEHAKSLFEEPKEEEDWSDYEHPEAERQFQQEKVKQDYFEEHRRQQQFEDAVIDDE